MKKYYLLSILLLLLVSCSKDNPKNIIEEVEEEEETTNLAPNDFDLEVNGVTHEKASINWDQATDPENDSITYSVFLNETLVIEDSSILNYEFIGLDELTQYSGKVVAKDTHNNETFVAFSFQTEKYYLKYLKRHDYGEGIYGTGGYAAGSPFSMLKTDDMKYIISGNSTKLDGSGYQFFVSKIDYEGNEIWKKFYDYPLDDAWRFKMGKTSTGYILAGHHHVLNLDFDGNLIWYKKLDSSDILDSSAEIQSVKQDSQGNIFLVGGRGSENSNIQQQAVLTKLDIFGTLIWEKIYEPSRRNFFNDIITTETGDLIILGSTETNGATSDQEEQIDFWVLKMNSEGEIIWENTFGDEKYDFPNQIISTSDNSYVFIGYGPSLFKIDNLGNLIWSNTEPSTYHPAFSISETNDNGFVTTGKFDFGNYGALAISKYDNNGNLEWEKEIQESFTYLMGYAILTEDDGGYRVAGTSNKNFYYNDEKPNLLIYKTDPEGNFE